ncbi:MAG: pimeloyl-ACP methyl ester carboxylesterase [Maribacter sp.]|jgi:pimeloyl-ACP methyl ester carboxylesterase
MKKFLFFLGVVLLIGIIVLFTYTPPLSDKYGQLDIELFIGDSLNQPLIVGFGGGGGGNDWSRSYMKGKRDSLIEKGYAILAIGYFNSGENTPKELDRISLNAMADSILNIANGNKNIDQNKIALIGGSKGGELVLNLASRYEQFNSVIAMSTSHVSFPAITVTSNTSSWMYNDEEVTYVPAPLKTIYPAIKGDLYTAFEVMLEDEEAARRAVIKVENINGPILIMSAKDDEQWAATRMSNRITERLDEKNFKHHYEHFVMEGGHAEPLNHFDKVLEFLDRVYR